MTDKQIKDLKRRLSVPQKIVLVAHRNPDGDAIGSSLAMQHYLRLKGHSVHTVLPNDVPGFLKWLPAIETVYRFDKQNKQSKDFISNSDLLFLLDFNALHRVGEDMQRTLEHYAGTFVMVDHHQQPEPISDYIYSDTSICSTCQMVYHFIDMMGDLPMVNSAIATCLYTGIMTDTGSFRFATTTNTTHNVVAHLIEKGADNAKIYDRVFNTNSQGKLKLLGVALSNLKILADYNTSYVILSQDELDAFDYQKGDTEGFVNYGLSIKGIYFAAIFIEDIEQGIIKISFRSKGSFSVNQFARKHFNGGGHENAAGGRSMKNMKETIESFLALLPQYKTALAKSYEN